MIDQVPRGGRPLVHLGRVKLFQGAYRDMHDVRGVEITFSVLKYRVGHIIQAVVFLESLHNPPERPLAVPHYDGVDAGHVGVLR